MANKKFTVASEFFTDKKPIEDKIEKPIPTPTRNTKKTVFLYVTEEIKARLKDKATSVGRTVTGYIKQTLKKNMYNELNDVEKLFKPQGKICLNLDMDLYIKVKEEAQKQDRSVNNFILQVVMNDVQNS